MRPVQTAAAVVIGGGAFGAATAYHLRRRGADVVLVDQHAMGSQTSARAAGLTSKAASTPVMALLRHESGEAFERFVSRTFAVNSAPPRSAPIRSDPTVSCRRAGARRWLTRARPIHVGT